MSNEVNVSSPKMHLPALKEYISLGSFFFVTKSNNSVTCQTLESDNNSTNRLANQEVKVRLYQRADEIKLETPPSRQRQASSIIECTQTNNVETKRNDEFGSACFLILHKNIVEDISDALGTGDCFLLRFSYYQELKFITTQ